MIVRQGIRSINHNTNNTIWQCQFTSLGSPQTFLDSRDAILSYLEGASPEGKMSLSIHVLLRQTHFLPTHDLRLASGHPSPARLPS